MDYLALPLRLKKGYLNKAGLYESISVSIGLLLSSRLGTLPFNASYGCDIWEKEFSDIYTANKADIRASIRNAIDKFEKRLYNVSVTLVSVDVSHLHALGVAVKVIGLFQEDGEEKKFEETYTIG
ncbi:MAG: GPW/gp25 family protein [Candidatus Zixiibacteriota bacterium]